MLYIMLVILTVGGLLYRYVPTTIAFIPGDRYFYFPTVMELIISGGFVALAVIGYLYTVKNYQHSSRADEVLVRCATELINRIKIIKVQSMSKRIVIDPVTRIEGHLRVDVEVDNGKVKNSWASGTMWRGIEKILVDRDPREAWIFAQRFCGVCTTVHAIASVRSVENSLKLDIPLNAQYIRNIILIAHALHDHIVHFYHLSALDYVDVVSALKGDPAQTSALAESLSPWTRNSKNEIKAVKDKVAGFVSRGNLGIFANGYWGHPAMHLDPNVNLLALTHYMQALEFQRISNQVVAMLGSKTPNIQNLAVGGVANAINLDNQHTLNMSKLANIKGMLDQVVQFVEEVYFPDACAVAAMYPEWFKYGGGVKNYLAVPDLPIDVKGSKYDLPGGMIFDGNMSTLYPLTSHTTAV
jgi:hydrogenase large subunit